MATASKLWIAYTFSTHPGRIQYVSKLPSKENKGEWGFDMDGKKAAHLTEHWRTRFHAEMKRRGSRGFEREVQQRAKVEKVKARPITDYLSAPDRPRRSVVPSAQILGANAEKIKVKAKELHANDIGACRVIRETVKAFPSESNGLIKLVLCEALKLNPGTVNRQIALERKAQGMA